MISRLVCPGLDLLVNLGESWAALRTDHSRNTGQSMPCLSPPHHELASVTYYQCYYLSSSLGGLDAIVGDLQVGRLGTTDHRQARETLAQMSEWMLNRGLLFSRSAAPAAKAYSAGQLRLTWIDAG